MYTLHTHVHDNYMYKFSGIQNFQGLKSVKEKRILKFLIINKNLNHAPHAPSSYHGNNATNETEVLKMLRIDTRSWVDL